MKNIIKLAVLFTSILWDSFAAREHYSKDLFVYCRLSTQLNSHHSSMAANTHFTLSV